MLLYAICLSPLLSTLDKQLTGLGIGKRRARTSIIACAGDVTILVTSPSGIQKIHDALHSYEEATGEKVNIRKSRTVPIKSWNTSLRIMDIPYYSETKLLEIHITSTIQASSLRIWTFTTAKIEHKHRKQTTGN
jgi:hypothetical protein